MVMDTEKMPEDAGIPNETQNPKERKETVEYRPGEPGSDCVSCTHFVEPESCEKVVGLIYRSGTCNMWEPDTEVEGVNTELEGMGQDEMEAFLFGGEQ